MEYWNLSHQYACADLVPCETIDFYMNVHQCPYLVCASSEDPMELHICAGSSEFSLP